MKKKSSWFAVGMFFVVLLVGAYSGFADKSQWAYETPINIGDSDFTGSEAMVSMEGTVKKIEPMHGVKNGMQMQFIAEEGGKWIVYMGPKWFTENQRIKFAAGDKVKVRGKKYGGAIIASEISKGGWTMKFRNEADGQAAWECCFPYKEKKD
ncbi:MAG: hypothetical protein HGB33_05645 [Syntrophaceae bacterium]|nr:hypothetical protein [Syntrophaceae bacterium]